MLFNCPNILFGLLRGCPGEIDEYGEVLDLATYEDVRKLCVE